MQSCNLQENVAFLTIAKLQPAHIKAKGTPDALQDDVYMTIVGLGRSAILVTVAAAAYELQGLA